MDNEDYPQDLPQPEPEPTTSSSPRGFKSHFRRRVIQPLRQNWQQLRGRRQQPVDESGIEMTGMRSVVDPSGGQHAGLPLPPPPRRPGFKSQFKQRVVTPIRNKWSQLRQRNPADPTVQPYEMQDIEGGGEGPSGMGGAGPSGMGSAGPSGATRGVQPSDRSFGQKMRSTLQKKWSAGEYESTPGDRIRQYSRPIRKRFTRDQYDYEVTPDDRSRWQRVRDRIQPPKQWVPYRTSSTVYGEGEDPSYGTYRSHGWGSQSYDLAPVQPYHHIDRQVARTRQKKHNKQLSEWDEQLRKSSSRPIQREYKDSMEGNRPIRGTGGSQYLIGDRISHKLRPRVAHHSLPPAPEPPIRRPYLPPIDEDEDEDEDEEPDSIDHYF